MISGYAVVIDDLKAIPSELVVEKLVSQVELDCKQEKVKKFT